MELLRRILRRIFGSVVLTTVTVVGAPVAFSVTVVAGLILLPLPASIPLPKANPTIQPTVIFDRNGQPIATLETFNRNLPFTDADVPQVLKEAVISDEDRNFYHEGGVDLRGTARALMADLRSSAPVQGGSTITQQYVKLAYTNQSRTVLRKVREAILASQLAREASKEDILYHYLTVIYLGDGNYGAAAAASTYFHTALHDLTPSQAATLAGLIPAPSSRDPERHLSSAEAARELVLGKMLQQHYLTQEQYTAAMASRLVPAGDPASPAGATVVFPTQQVTTRFPDFVNYVQGWLEQHFTPQQLQEGGLRVQTTLDPTAQQDAYNAVDTTLRGSAPPVDMALAAVEPQTGFVVAVVGGRGYGGSGPGEQVNLALGGCPQKPGASAHVAFPATCWDGGMIVGGGGGRQPGSAFKAFTLAAAYAQGIPPSAGYPAPAAYQIPGCVVLPGKPATSCQIHNDPGEGGYGYETLAAATAASTNTVYAQVAQQVGCPNVASTASKLGVETAYYSTPPFFFCASYALGELGVSPLDMASAYGVFADHGQRAAPTPILEIVNAQNKVLVDNIHHAPTTTEALPSNVADNVTNTLQGVIQFGTAAGTAQLGRPAAGKTGTTSNTTDAWFVGYTPTLSTAVWMGNETSDATSLGSVQGCFVGGGCTTYRQVYGATWPAITWREFMSAALTAVPATPFSAPAPIVTPQEAAALRAPVTTTTLPITPGPEGYIEPTPPGGPYVAPEPTPYAPPPPTTAPPTTIPATTTTSEAPTTVGTTTTTGPP